MFQHNRQQKSSASDSDHGMLNISPQPTSFSASTNPSLSYDTPTRQSSETDMQPKKTSQTNVTTISSADYALNVMFSQFEQMADAKMSFILNLGVVSSYSKRRK